MRAYRLSTWGVAPELVEIDTPAPGVGEVRLRVAGVGLCHSDLLFIDARPGDFPYPTPFTLGHEIAGWVDALGPDVDDLAVGDAVVASAHLTCGVCEYCRRGYDNYCVAHAGGLGFGLDGGLADFVVVQRRALVALASIDPRTAGPLADAGCTSMHAVQRVLPRLHAGAHVVVFGLGGLGSYALQFLRALASVTVIGVDVDAARLERRLSSGWIDHGVTMDADAARAIRAATNDRGAEVALDFVGSDDTLITAQSVARPLGAIGFVGAAGGTAHISWTTIPRECEIFIPQGGTMSDLAQVVSLVERGDVITDNEYFALDDVEEAYRRLRDGTLAGRAVVVPDGRLPE